MVSLIAPWALAGGALAATALLAIYFFQRRHREREVSSLLLWAAVRPPSAGGRHREPPRLPLTFWLELLVLALLALAAAAPLLPLTRRARPLVVVLDDSLSMQASREESRGVVEGKLTGGAYAPIRIVLAGGTPRMAGAAAGSQAETLHQLTQWTCLAPTGDLDAAIAMALQSGGPNALILVVSDHAPSGNLPKGRLQWIARGRQLANVAFVGAARSAGERDRATFEIANFAGRPQATTLTISRAGVVLQRRRLELAAGGRTRVDAELPVGGGAIDAAISGGAAFDDRVTLLPERRPPVRVRIDVADAGLRELVTTALDASHEATITDVGPELLITDHAVAAGAIPWRLEIDARKAAGAFVGPFTVDRTHPLTEGVALEGVIWGAPLQAASPAVKPVGVPVVMAGGLVVLGDEPSALGHVVRLALDPVASNLQRSPAWPALLWNLLEWRRAAAPGVHYANVPLGGSAAVTLDAEGVRADIRAPDGSLRQAVATAGPLGKPIVAIEAAQPGIWTVSAKGVSYRFACNALVPEESDFSRAASGVWGAWSGEALENNGRIDISPFLLLLALALLAGHQRLAAEGTA
jgi:hypothetical protein